MTLLTKRTIGASSTSSRETSAADLVVAGADIERVEVDALVVAEVRHRGVDLLHRLVEELLQLVVLDDDRIDRQAGLELDLVDGVQVGRVGDPEEQPLAALEERQHAMLGEELVAHRLHGVEVDGEGVEIEQRHAVFGGRRDRDVARRRRARGDQLRHEAGALLVAPPAGPRACRSSSTTPSWTSRWGRPPRPLRAGAQGYRGVFIHGLAQHPGPWSDPKSNRQGPTINVKYLRDVCTTLSLTR